MTTVDPSAARQTKSVPFLRRVAAMEPGSMEPPASGRTSEEKASPSRILPRRSPPPE